MSKVKGDGLHPHGQKSFNNLVLTAQMLDPNLGIIRNVNNFEPRIPIFPPTTVQSSFIPSKDNTPTQSKNNPFPSNSLSQPNNRPIGPENKPSRYPSISLPNINQPIPTPTIPPSLIPKHTHTPNPPPTTGVASLSAQEAMRRFLEQ